MELRRMGNSGLQVPVLSLGTGPFGGRGPLFGALGGTQLPEARRLVDISLDAGLTLFDTADSYSDGESERVLGEALGSKRDQALISTKSTAPFFSDPTNAGSSRARLIRSVDASLTRLRTDYIDLFQLHAYDAGTPIDEVLSTLDDLVRAGKLRYVGVSNFSGWQLMKSLSLAEKYGYPRYVAHQVYYSLIGRDYEWELMPLAADQGVGAIVWSPLGWGRLTGKIRRGQPIPDESRLHSTAHIAPPVEDELLYDVVDALEEIAAETGKTVPQVALNWLLQRPTVSSVIIGARDEHQLQQNLGAVGWSLTQDQIERLNKASTRTPPYPYFQYRGETGFAQLSPPIAS